ncbi:helix-turn-helix domain-containing protein [Prescottella equi]|uniref:helix-turn-helix domain-containing protein n=1 Tax=Rhodococcus hoagii TaxID=43767 RepID=UPI000A103875|nr:helix-turn-helix transcriptional regulator [Prescottella equi]MBM4725359.1 helix-turn-helix domain-containing protein [Prescottella equi]NKR24447.1 helix-turn-helix domain-containing protein [Prescottella equi]NKR42682.1 helix-turn-helix domain-containing protein [Prescottella equi]NKR61625.1 helix-turn-helix domain-containing protein [Prescottella equi]NKR70171.1 helix-turn-helix domain-containing protein [Prescottella equi]
MSPSPAVELGEFLKTRRAALTPRAVGLPDHSGRRRVPGLRREEVALLASISTDYYTRIEQGRRHASSAVLDALGHVLHLDEQERAYMFDLAGRVDTRTDRRAAQQVNPQLARILGQITSPAFVLGRRMDVLAWNDLAAALITDFDAVPVKDRNYARLMFDNPTMRRLNVDWESMARACVAMLRMEAGQNPHDKKMAAMVGELSMRNEDFRRWWADHRVATRVGGRKRLQHPIVGDLVLDWDALAFSGEPSQQLVVWTAEPGSASDESLHLLASWKMADDRSVPATIERTQ